MKVHAGELRPGMKVSGYTVVKVVPRGKQVAIFFKERSPFVINATEKLSVDDQPVTQSILGSVVENLLREAEDEEDDKKEQPEKEEKKTAKQLNKSGTSDSVDARIDKFMNEVDDISDPEMFANHVMRLIDHFDTLLDMRDIILRRAINKVKAEAGDQTAEEFELALDEQYGVKVGETKWDRETEKYSAPDNAEATGGSLG